MGAGGLPGGKGGRIDSFCRSRLMTYVEMSEVTANMRSEDLEEEICRMGGEEAVEHSRLMHGAAGASLIDAYRAAANDDFREAEAAVDKIGEFKGPAWSAQTKSDIYEMAGRLEDALAHASAYNRNAPLQEQLFATEADLLYRLGRTGELARLCTVWDDFEKDRLDLHLNRARVMYAKGNIRRAARLVNALLTLEPLKHMARLLKGDILARAKRYQDAIEQCDRGLEMSDDIMLQTARVRALLGDGQHQEALEECDDFLSQYPDHREFLNLRKAARENMFG